MDKKTLIRKIKFDVPKYDEFDIDKCKNQIGMFIEKYFPDIAPDIKKVIVSSDVVKTRSEITGHRGYNDQRNIKGTIIKEEDGYIVIYSIPSVMILKNNTLSSTFSKDDIAEAEVEQNQMLYHELQHVKNEKEQEEFFRIIDNKNVSKNFNLQFRYTMIRKFVDEYFSYYKTQYIFPLNDCSITDDLYHFCEEYHIYRSKGKFNNEEMLDLSANIFYCFAAVLAFSKANQYLSSENNQMVYDNAFKEVFNKIETLIDDYQKCSKTLDVYFEEQLEILFKEYLSLFF